MPTYGDDFVVTARTEGAEKLDQFARTAVNATTKIREGLRGLADSPLVALDEKLKISDTTIASYDRLLRTMTLLKAAQADLAQVQKKYDLGIPGSTTRPYTGPAGAEKDAFRNQPAATSALSRATAAVDAANERVAKEYLSTVQKEASDRARTATQVQRAGQRIYQARAKVADQEEAAAAKARAAAQREVEADQKAAVAAEARARKEAEAAAETARANQTRIAQVKQTLADRPVSNYPNADLSTALGRAQRDADIADTKVNVSKLKLAELYNSEAITVPKVIEAETRLASAENAAASAQTNLARATNRSGSLTDQFKLGFHGSNQDRSYVEQIGQAFKFSVLYGTAYKVLFGITSTLQDALNEGIAFQQAMTELALASGQSVAALDGLRKNLGSAATQAGAAPSQGVLVGARSLGLFGASAGSGATPAEQARIATISAQVVSRAAFGSGMQPEELQRNLAAIAQAFQQGPEGQVRAYDLDAYLSRRLGSVPGGTYQSVSESATAGAAAGFSQEQITAIASLLQARTGQTDAAVAGYMAQIFSRSGEGALVGVEQKYGVDSTQNLAGQIAKLADVYAKNPAARDEISAAFGRGKVQNAAIALLQGYPEAQSAARDAQTKALGAGDQAFNLRLDNVGGQLQVFLGDLKALESEIGRSGLLTVVGALVKIFDETVQGLTGLLTIWNRLDAVTRSLVAAILLEEAVRRSGVLTRGATTAADDLLAGTMYARPGVGAAEGAATGGARAAAALRSIAGPLAIFATAVGVGQAANANRKLGEARGSALGEFTTATVGFGSTPDEYRSEASALQLQSDQAKEAASGFFAKVVQFGEDVTGDTRDADAALVTKTHAEALRLQALGNYKQTQEAQTPANLALITSFDAEGLSSAMDAITTAGGNARDRLDAVAASLNAGADAAKRAAEAFDPKLFAGEAARPIYEGLATTGLQFGAQDAKNLDFKGLTGLASGTAFNQALTPAQVAERLQQSLQTRGITSATDITGKSATRIATDIVGNTPETYLKGLGEDDPKKIAALQKKWIGQVRDLLLGQAQSVKDILSGKLTLTSAELDATVTEIVNDAQTKIGLTQETDHGSRIGIFSRLVALIRRSIRQAPGGATRDVQNKLDAARRDLSNAQIDELEDLRSAAQQNAHSKAEIASIGHGFLVREIHNAIRNKNQDRLVQIIGVAGKYGIDIARNAINDAIAAAKAAVAVSNQIQAFAANELAGIGHFIGQLPPSSGNAKADRRLAGLQELARSLSHSVHGTNADDPYLHGDFPGAGDKTQTDPGPTAAQIAAARQTAYAQGSESPIAQARASLASARADMAAAKKGTTEYYSALGAYLEARNQLTDAILDFHNNQYLLGHDITDPLVQARAALRAARAKLRSDAGKPADVRAADKVAERQAQAGVEAQAFQQRLDAVQTAEQLGRISYSAYINYLNHERDRLRGVAHRSYQQQQELNQIDQLLKTAADQMQGQWNFGDIKLPTPYQVRRYIEEQGGGGTGGGGGSVINDGPKNPGGRVENHHVNITVDGADTGQILKILRQYVGQFGRTMTTGTRHR